MKVHELPFNDTIKADFELIMRRVLSKFPAAKIYTIPDADLAEIQVYVVISGVSKEGVESVDLSDVQLQLQLLSLPQKEIDTLQEITGVKLNPGRSPL